MEDWRNKPTAIDKATTGTKLALFIDESGNPMYKGTSETNRYFTLCGCLFTISELKDAQDKMLALKSKYWVNGEFAYKEGCQRVTFHMAEIAQARKGFKNKNNPFSYIEENIAPFYLEYKQLVRELDFFVFSVTVDKLAMQRRYCHPYDPYAYALELLLERVHHCVARFYPESSDSVAIIIESSGKKEDAIHLKCIAEIADNGTTYQGKRCFSWISGAFFCPKRNACGKSYYGLEIADFCAYPIKMYFVKNQESSEEFEIIKPKIYKKGVNAQSFGLKKVP